MTVPGFNPTQIKQLSDMFAHVVDSLSRTIKESEERTTSTLRAEIKSETQKVRDDLHNFIATTPTKYQVNRLEKAVFGQTG
jgi:translation elongation factor EF-Ts